MSSSLSSLSRTRSVRDPPSTKSNEPGGSVSPSRLPTTTRTRSTTTSTTTTTASSGTVTTATAQKSRQASSAKGVSGGSARPLARAPSTRKPTSTVTSSSSAAIGRTATSAARPSSSGGPPSSDSTSTKERVVSSHARAKSTVASLTSVTTLRPPSRPSSSAHTTTSEAKLGAHRTRNTASPTASSTVSSTGSSTQPAAVQTSSRQIRLQAPHKRVPSQLQQAPATGTTTTAAAAASSSNATLPPRRPAFNTLQQHYSPAKSLAPKPLTSTFLAPPSPSKQPVNVAITAETSRLQTELLQLSLLHRGVHAVAASWHASARSKLEDRFEALCVADEELRARERVGAERRGLQDLVRWGSGNVSSSEKRADTRQWPSNRNRPTAGSLGNISLEEKVQALDQVFNGLWILGESGGRYQRTVLAFEAWARRVAQILEAQRCNDIDSLLGDSAGAIAAEEPAIFVSDLDVGAWKEDHAGLTRILEGWRRMLDQVGHLDSGLDIESSSRQAGLQTASGKQEANDGAQKKPRASSGLSRMLSGCHNLVHDMLDELKIMEEIELDALSVEEQWMARMESRLRAESKSASSRLRDGTGAIMDNFPSWKSLVA
ncbi:hypothetical protein F5Y17DRAFT_291003 [Xylariaceae sp. FL0594]|nr:hypothetical protein F5Y17DRAFT_291003 [Xylariaceae sp. FL0594]